MQLSSIPFLKRARRAFRLWRQVRRLRSIEKALHQAWPETKERCKSELPPERAAYVRARVDLDAWAWFHGVPFYPFGERHNEGEEVCA